MNSKDEDRINIKCNFINDYFNTTETEYAEIIEEIIDRYFPHDEQGFNIENVRKSLNFLMNEARTDQFRKDTDERVQSIKDAKKEIAKQIFEEIKDAQIDVSRLAPEEVHAAVQRSREYWFVLLDANKVDALKKKYEVD